MGNTNKRSVTNVYAMSAVLSAATPQVVFDIAGMHNFSITVATTATSDLPYTIYTAPTVVPNTYVQVTSTNVRGTGTGGFTINTFDGNNNAYCKILFNTISQTGGHASGALKVILSYNER